MSQLSIHLSNEPGNLSKIEKYLSAKLSQNTLDKIESTKRNGRVEILCEGGVIDANKICDSVY